MQKSTLKEKMYFYFSVWLPCPQKTATTRVTVFISSIKVFDKLFSKSLNVPLQILLEFVSNELNLFWLGGGGGVHSGASHSGIDLILHRENLGEGASKLAVDVRGGGLDGAVHHQVAFALEDEKKVFHRLFFIHTEINPIIL